MGQVCDRKTKSLYEDNQYGQNYLKFLYKNFFGRIILKVITMPFISKIGGHYNNSKRSVKHIASFIEKNHIDMSLYKEKEYSSFNDFFIREKKRIEFDDEPKAFCSPADSKLLFYKISDDLKITIKNNVYTLKELTKNEDIVTKFAGGNCLVFRLSVDNYHRYHSVDECEVTGTYEIKGKLHTVNSISKDYRIYAENYRVVNSIKTRNFNELIFIEVGAMLVGKVINSTSKCFKRGDEMGYFEYGGSTVVVLTQDNIAIDEDILNNSKNEIETKVQVRRKNRVIN